MKLKKGRASYPMPPIGILHSVALVGWDGSGIGERLQEVSQTSLERMRSVSDPPELGKPIYFALAWYKSRIMFFPEPSKACEVKIRYLPPMQEF